MDETHHEADTREPAGAEPAAGDGAGDGAVDAGATRVAPAVWPLAAIVAAQFAAMTLPGRLAPGTPVQFYGLMLGGAGGTLLILLWWFTRRRVRLAERILGFVLLVTAIVVFAALLLHPMMLGFPLLFYVIPSLGLAAVPLFAVARATGWPAGRAIVLGGLVATLAAWCAVRADGIDGNLTAAFSPRWAPTAEEVFLEDAGGEPTADADTPDSVELRPGDWPGFRGPARDGRLAGAVIRDDWKSAPPRELWRRKVRPGWGSVTIVDGLLFTQEQRGEQEVVAAYDAATGEPLWVNEVATRFEESAAGPGPRATPTFREGRLYTVGASGAVQCLDAATGDTIWRGDLTRDTTAVLTTEGWWGFAASPLVVEPGDGRTLVAVFAGTPQRRDPGPGPAGDAVVAYDAATGEPAWTGGVGTHGYASPHLATLADTPQMLVVSDAGLESLDPATGERLWLYDWNTGGYPRVVQPLVLPGDRVVLATGYGLGTHALAVSRDGDDWTTATEWSSKKLKPYFNDLVHHEGHLYGFDGKFFTCIDAATGEAVWPRSVRRDAAFGHGQALLVEDAGLIVLVTETEGDVVLLEANPQTLVVRGRFSALDGKTWNHPVVHGGRLFVRNGVEMACYDLLAADDAEAIAAAR